MLYKEAVCERPAGGSAHRKLWAACGVQSEPEAARRYGLLAVAYNGLVNQNDRDVLTQTPDSEDHADLDRS